eukprot:4794184-Pleurochrysis_carterae.AAC.1
MQECGLPSTLDILSVLGRALISGPVRVPSCPSGACDVMRTAPAHVCGMSKGKARCVAAPACEESLAEAPERVTRRNDPST